MFLPCLFAMNIFLIAGWKERGWLARGPSWTAWFLGSLHFVLPLWAGPQGVNSALVWWNKRRRRDTQIYKSCCRHRDEVEKLENETCHCSWRQRGLRMALCLSKTFLFPVAFHVVADLLKSIEQSFLWNWLYGIQRGYLLNMFQIYTFIYSAIFSCLLLPSHHCILESVFWRRALAPRWMLRRTAVWTCICPMIWYSLSVCGLMYWFLSISLPIYFVSWRVGLSCIAVDPKNDVMWLQILSRICKVSFGWHELLSTDICR